jgi:hypothetical protein
MVWNYRVVHHQKTDNFDEYYSLVECFYDDGQLFAYSKDILCGDSIDELRSSLQYMMAALDKPVIEKSNLPKTIDEVVEDYVLKGEK